MAPTKKTNSRKATEPSTSTRKKVRQGQTTLPESEEAVRGSLTFSNKVHQANYKQVVSKQFIPGKYIDTPSLDCLNILDDVFKYVENIGWKPFFDIFYPAYTPLCHEFYATFEFNKPEPLTLNSPGVVKFRLMKKEFSFSLTQFNIALGFITEEYSHTDEYLASTCEFSPNFHSFYAYCELSTCKTYNPKTSKACFLRDAALKYLHRILVYTFSGRHAGSTTVNETELYFLWSMKNGIKVNLGYWLATRFDTVVQKKNKPLILGSLITHLAIKLGVLKPSSSNSFHPIPNLHVACEMLPLDLKCLAGMGLLTRHSGVLSIRSAGDIDHHIIQHSKDALRAEERSWEFSSSEDDSPIPGSSSVQLQRLEDRQIRIEERQIQMEQTMAQIKQTLAALLDQTKNLPGFVHHPSSST